MNTWMNISGTYSLGMAFHQRHLKHRWIFDFNFQKTYQPLNTMGEISAFPFFISTLNSSISMNHFREEFSGHSVVFLSFHLISFCNSEALTFLIDYSDLSYLSTFCVLVLLFFFQFQDNGHSLTLNIRKLLYIKRKKEISKLNVLIFFPYVDILTCLGINNNQAVFSTL